MPIAGSVCLCFATMQRLSGHNCAFTNSETSKILTSFKSDKDFFFITAQLLSGVGAFNFLTIPPDIVESNSVSHTPLLSSSTFCILHSCCHNSCAVVFMNRHSARG